MRGMFGTGLLDKKETLGQCSLATCMSSLRYAKRAVLVVGALAAALARRLLAG
jgi:hypothetical protein